MCFWFFVGKNRNFVPNVLRNFNLIQKFSTINSLVYDFFRSIILFKRLTKILSPQKHEHHVMEKITPSTLSVRENDPSLSSHSCLPFSWIMCLLQPIAEFHKIYFYFYWNFFFFFLKWLLLEFGRDVRFVNIKWVAGG